MSEPGRRRLTASRRGLWRSRPVRTHPGVERLWLFGSRACGTHRDRSDIDLAVRCAGLDADKQRPSTAHSNAIALGVSARCRCGGKTRSATCSAPRLPRTGWCCGSRRPGPTRQRPQPGCQFKPFQERVLSQLNAYLAELQTPAKTADAQAQVLRRWRGAGYRAAAAPEGITRPLPGRSCREAALLPDSSQSAPHSNSRWDGRAGPSQRLPPRCPPAAAKPCWPRRRWGVQPMVQTPHGPGAVGGAQ